MECDRFDTDLLIDEVEKRPAIWDMTSSVYKDRGAKKRSCRRCKSQRHGASTTSMLTLYSGRTPAQLISVAAPAW